MMEMITRWVFLIQWTLRESRDWVWGKIQTYSKIVWGETKSQTVEKSKSLWLKIKKTLRVVKTILKATLILAFLGSLLYGVNLWWPGLFIVGVPSKSLVVITGLIVVGVLVPIYLFTRYLTKSDPVKPEGQTPDSGEKGEQEPDPEKDEEKKGLSYYASKAQEKGGRILGGLIFLTIVNLIFLVMTPYIMPRFQEVVFQHKLEWFTVNLALVLIVIAAQWKHKVGRMLTITVLACGIIFPLFWVFAHSPEGRKASAIYEKMELGGRPKAEVEEEESEGKTIFTVKTPKDGSWTEKKKMPDEYFRATTATTGRIKAEIFEMVGNEYEIVQTIADNSVPGVEFSEMRGKYVRYASLDKEEVTVTVTK